MSEDLCININTVQNKSPLGYWFKNVLINIPINRTHFGFHVYHNAFLHGKCGVFFFLIIIIHINHNIYAVSKMEMEKVKIFIYYILPEIKDITQVKDILQKCKRLKTKLSAGIEHTVTVIVVTRVICVHCNARTDIFNTMKYLLNISPCHYGA